MIIIFLYAFQLSNCGRNFLHAASAQQPAFLVLF